MPLALAIVLASVAIVLTGVGAVLVDRARRRAAVPAVGPGPEAPTSDSPSGVSGRRRCTAAEFSAHWSELDVDPFALGRLIARHRALESAGTGLVDVGWFGESMTPS